MVQLLWKMVWQFLKKLNIDLTYDPGILPVMYSREIKIYIHTSTHTYTDTHTNTHTQYYNTSKKTITQMSIN